MLLLLPLAPAPWYLFSCLLLLPPASLCSCRLLLLLLVLVESQIISTGHLSPSHSSVRPAAWQLAQSP